MSVSLGETADLRLKASHGLAISLRRGERLRIENLFGTQVVDTWLLAGDDPFEHSSMDHTRSVNSNIFLEKEMVVASSLRRPMARLVEDTSPGRHDTLLCPCNAAIYRELRCEGYHRSCTDNFHEALGAVGITLPFTPASLNLFMNVPVAADGSVERVAPASRPGDAVVLQAEMDVTVVLSACPQDVTPINGTERTPRDIGLAIRPARGAPL
ncbi:urea carboxylase-associated family protein [Labrys monachus]|uniref:Uncharacterized protein YcgI (DUF1989 family) n=1 Tax=Labrys monachus TaxID=217067 RepID=A0ABU0FGZ0_9HYPH|nr:urea carboxylase-associated family protein [Labrys monachus]MDQ0393879.1 uncharacterized protein YcgI (DUF1989 family) [Labrys monachus]